MRDKPEPVAVSSQGPAEMITGMVYERLRNLISEAFSCSWMGHAYVLCFHFLQWGGENFSAKHSGVAQDCWLVLAGECATAAKGFVQPCAFAVFISCQLKTRDCKVWLFRTLLGFVVQVLLLSPCRFSLGVFWSVGSNDVWKGVYGLCGGGWWWVLIGELYSWDLESVLEAWGVGFGFGLVCFSYIFMIENVSFSFRGWNPPAGRAVSESWIFFVCSDKCCSNFVSLWPLEDCVPCCCDFSIDTVPALDCRIYWSDKILWKDKVWLKLKKKIWFDLILWHFPYI